MWNSFKNDLIDSWNEIFSLEFLKPKGQIIGLIAMFGVMVGGCGAWMHKGDSAQSVSLKALALESSKQKPLRAVTKSKANKKTDCNFVSEKPLATFQVKSKKGFNERALLVMGASTSKNPTMYIRNVKDPSDFHCINGFNEKLGRYSQLTQMVYLENGAYEVFIGTDKQNEWTRQKVHISAM
jgi:hypothetical protein